MSTLRTDTIQTTDSSFSIDVDQLGNLSGLTDNTDPAKGAALVGYKGRTVADRLNDTVNVLDFGADPTGVADSLAAFNAARNKLQANNDYRGGKIVIPKGYYKLSNTWLFTPYVAGQVHNMIIEGDGMQSVVLDFSTAPAGTDGIAFTGQGSQIEVSGLLITGAKRDGLSIVDGSYFSVSKMRIQFSGRHGFFTDNTFMASLDNIWSRGNAGNGIQFNQAHTSITMYRVFASDNTGNGFILNGMTYSTLVSCGSDNNVRAYAISNCRGLVFTGCGSEANHTDGWFLFSSNASHGTLPSAYQDIHGVELIGCVAYFNSSSAPGNFGNFLNASASDGCPIQFSMTNCTSVKANVADHGIILDSTNGPISYDEKSCSHDGTTVFFGSQISPTNYREAILTSGSAFALTSGTPRSLTSITLPAGDWLVTGNVIFVPQASTSVIGYYAGLGTTVNTLPVEADYSTGGTGFTRVFNGIFNLQSPPVKIRSDGTTAVYLQAQAAFSAGTLSGCGKITATKL